MKQLHTHMKGKRPPVHNVQLILIWLPVLLNVKWGVCIRTTQPIQNIVLSENKMHVKILKVKKNCAVLSNFHGCTVAHMSFLLMKCAC